MALLEKILAGAGKFAKGYGISEIAFMPFSAGHHPGVEQYVPQRSLINVNLPRLWDANREPFLTFNQAHPPRQQLPGIRVALPPALLEYGDSGYVPSPRPTLMPRTSVAPPILPGETGWTPTLPITPTTTVQPTTSIPEWQRTYQEVFGEPYRPGLEPVRADVRAMPAAPPETMTVKTGIFRDPRYGSNLPKDHPQYEAAQGHTFRIRPVHQVLADAATRAQNRLPVGIHASPVELGDTSLIMSKRSLPIRSPLPRRM